MPTRKPKPRATPTLSSATRRPKPPAAETARAAASAPKAATAPDSPDAGGPRRYLDALYRISGFVTAVSSLPKLLELVMAESKALMNAEGSSLLLYDADCDDLYFEVALGEAGEKVKQIRLQLGEGIGGLCARDRKPIIVNDTKSDPRHSKRADTHSSFVTRNLLAVPMIARGEKWDASRRYAVD